MEPLSIIAELCPHGNLYDYLHKWKDPIPWSFRIRCAVDIAEALKYLHNLNPKFVHLDVKTPNV